MTQKDIQRIETFAKWLKTKPFRGSVMVHGAPVGKMKISGKYEVEVLNTEHSNVFTAKPKDKRLHGLTYFN